MNRKLFRFILLLTVIGSLGCTPAPVTFHFTGDIMLSRSVEPILKEKGFNWPHSNFQELFQKDDLTIANLECPITTAAVPVHKYKSILFKAMPENASALKEAGYDLVTLGNNHVMDYEEPGLKDTLEALDHAGLKTIGAQQSAEKAKEPYFVEKQGTTYGFISRSVFPAEGYIYNPKGYDVALLNEKTLPQEIQAAKAQCDILIVCVHWGKEFEHTPSAQQKKVAHLIIDAGADLIVGHHPHVVQGIEKYNDKFIFYSLGNFIFDRQKPPGTDESIVLETTFEDKKLQPPTLIPVVIKESRPEPASEEKAKKMMEALNHYSEDLGITVIKCGEQWCIQAIEQK